MNVLIRILEVLFLIGVAGCLITIPVAGWGYASVLFQKNSREEIAIDDVPQTRSSPAD